MASVAPIEEVNAWRIKCRKCCRKLLIDACSDVIARQKFRLAHWYEVKKQDDDGYEWLCPACSYGGK